MTEATPSSASRQATKTYKDPVTGRVETCEAGSDVEKALKEQGYVEIDPETGEPKEKPKTLPAKAEEEPPAEEPPAPAVPKQPAPKKP